MFACMCRTHCNAEIVSLKEQCEERVETAKREVQMKMKKLSLSPEKPSPVRRPLCLKMLELGRWFYANLHLIDADCSVFYFDKQPLSWSIPTVLKVFWSNISTFILQQQKTSVEADKVDDAVFVKVKAPKDLNQTSSLSQIKKNKALELLTNDIVVDKGKEYEHHWDRS